MIDGLEYMNDRSEKLSPQKNVIFKHFFLGGGGGGGSQKCTNKGFKIPCAIEVLFVIWVVKTFYKSLIF